MPTFLETPRFPEHISAGSSSIPLWSTSITPLGSGVEQRNKNWLYPKFRYNVSMGIKDLEDLYAVYEFFIAVGGPAYGFRFKDYLDHTSAAYGEAVTATDQALGTGDGAEDEFQLYKYYTKGAMSLARPIKKPVAGTVVIAIDGTPTVSGWTVDTTTGIVTFAPAPANGKVLTAGFEFDVPVRFEQDEIAISFPHPDLGAAEITLLSLAYE